MHPGMRSYSVSNTIFKMLRREEKRAKFGPFLIELTKPLQSLLFLMLSFHDAEENGS